jgi:hypothetical protein
MELSFPKDNWTYASFVFPSFNQRMETIDRSGRLDE